MKRLSNVEDLSVGSFESGAHMLNLELHCHTAFSKDGLMGFDSLIRTAQKIGLDALAITDHDTMEGAREFQQRAEAKGLPLQIIAGEEKTLSGGIYDPQLNLTRIVGSNKRVIDEKMPHLASLLHEDLSSALGDQGLIIVAQRCVSIAELAKRITPRHHLLDINGWPELRTLPSYEGLCW